MPRMLSEWLLGVWNDRAIAFSLDTHRACDIRGRELARDESRTFDASSGSRVSNREQAPSHIPRLLCDLLQTRGAVHIQQPGWNPAFEVISGTFD
jgi:hypothetical protein